MNSKHKVTLMISLLVIFNIFIWVVAYIYFYNYPKFLALCLIAYGFGLRHAVDADHIAAIDNVTRKFMQNKKRPVTIGFFFSLGHSTVVVIMSFFVALGTIYMKDNIAQFQEIGGIIGSIVSGSFLLILAIINLIIFIDILRSFLKFRDNKVNGLPSDSCEELIEQKGLITKILRPMFKFVSKSWHMYIVGFLFGLGFDTASEIALLGISATQAAAGLSIWTIMIFPLLFMSGMCLIDTMDGILMLGVYGWAFVKPMKKLFYNMTITLVSFLIAFFIGGLEVLGVLSDKLNLQSAFWNYINSLNDNLVHLGYYIIGIFILSWLLSSLIYKIFNTEITKNKI
ncbi:MAG TPA: HoxN/HupN/NixA family nickel/cobalt transporter [Victivallales bacterium]|nr:HoxN/HupN/NixA family nickel/cobalt transporter [Victivallales bacterium]